MKMKGTIAILLVIALAAALVGCSPKGETQNLTDAPLTGETVADFASGAPAAMFPSDGWSNGNPFNVFWKSDCVSFSDGEMHLGIEKPASGGDNWEYFGGEERSSLWYGYGDFEVRMKPAKVEGTASTFFTCTGPYDTGLDGTPNQHDEIDIEFLGKNTKGVQFNYFVNGQGGHEYWYDLGFDASEEYHDYGFRWEENSITWFVDGKPVYKVNRQSGEPFPSHPGRILANYWCGTIEAVAWMGAYKDSAATADYQWIKSSAQIYDLNPAPAEQENGADEIAASAVDWSAVEPIELAFTSTNGKHEIESAGTVTKVTYSGIDNDWSNITAALEGKANGGNVMSLRLRNDDASDDHRVRIDLMKDGKCVNTSAMMDGAGVFTDLEWGGSFFENIPAGGEAEIEIVGSTEPDAIVIMLDSMRQGDEKQYSGAYTISDVKFASSGAEAAPSEPAQTDEPADESTVTINGAAVKVTTDGSYALDVTDAGFTAEYENIAGNSYQTVYMNTYEAMAGSNVFTAKLTNSGAEPANIRVDISCDVQSGNSTAANLAAAQNGAEVYTDLEWGGSTFTVQPGETADIAIEYDVERAPKGVLFFFDSAKYDDNGTHSGSVTVSEMAFSSGEVALEAAPAAVTTAAVIRDSSTAVPSAPKVKSIEINGRSSALNITDGYSVKTFDGGFSAEYKDLPGNSYKTVYCALGDMAGAYNTAVCEIENPGELEVKVRVDLTSAKAVANTNAANVRAVQDGAEAPTDLEWGGSVFVIAPQSKASVAVEYDPAREVDGLLFYFDSAAYDDPTAHSGAVRVTGIKLTNDGAEPTEKEESEKTEEKTPGVLVNDTVVAFEGQYDVAYAEDGASMTVSYENLEGGHYESLYGAVTELVGDCEAFSARITNNGAAPVRIRLDMSCETKKNNNTAANLLAAQDGKAVSTDLDWGGSIYVIEPGKTSEIYVEFDPSRTVQGLLFYFDSATYEDTGVYTGSVTLSDMTFCEKQEIDASEPASAVSSTPAEPVAVTGIVINGSLRQFEAQSTYGLRYFTDSAKVTYAEVKGNCYQNLELKIDDFSEKFNVFSAVLTNNGTETVKVRIDIEGTVATKNPEEGDMLAANLTATVNGAAVTTDLEWGGSMFELAAGETANVTVEYDRDRDARSVKLFFDSSKYDDPAPHSGSVTVSGLTLSEKTAAETVAESCTVVTDAVKNTVTATLSGEGAGKATVAAPEAVPTGSNTVVTTVKNTGTQPVQVKAEVKTAAPKLMLMKRVAVNEGDFVKIAPGEEVELEISFDASKTVTGVEFTIDSEDHTGSVVIGEIKFEEKQAEEPAAEPEPQPQPEHSAYATIKVNETELTFELQDTYTVTYGENGATAAYEDIPGASYKNLELKIDGITGEFNTFSGTLTNNGTAAVKVRIDVESERQINNTKAANTKATVNGEEVLTDTDWGGSSFGIAAGETASFAVEYDSSRTVKSVKLFFDSFTNGDKGTYTGSVTISGLTLSKTETTPEPQPEPEPDPEPEPQPQPEPSATALTVGEKQISFNGNNDYTVTYNADGTEATFEYAGIAGSSYKNAYGWYGAFGEADTLSFKVKNNGESAAKILTQISVGGTTIAEKVADVAANGEETVAIEFTTEGEGGIVLFIDTCWSDSSERSGSVTISGLTLSKAETDTAAQLTFTKEEE